MQRPEVFYNSRICYRLMPNTLAYLHINKKKIEMEAVKNCNFTVLFLIILLIIINLIQYYKMMLLKNLIKQDKNDGDGFH